MSAAPHARHVRALALGGASLGLGLAGHLQAGGQLGATGPLAFAAAFCGLSAWIYAWRRLPAPAVAAVLTANQLIVHASLAIGSAHPAGPAAMTDMDCGTAPTSPAGSAMSLLPTGWMLVAHLVASVLAAAAIVTVEGVWLALLALARWVTRAGRLTFSAPSPPARAVTTVGPGTPIWSSRPVGARPGRGPPCLSHAW